MSLPARKRKKKNAFGATSPPFIDYLKEILRRYPDGGQILKELIQNADDAKASEIVFICDERRYSTGSVWREALGKYQGPALYAFNNAVFTDEDWEGIQRAGRSIKQDDPTKVGRFGIGFNSIYHVTDLPCVFSSKHLAVFDPQMKMFDDEEEGYRWSLDDEEDRKHLWEFTDQFKPFQDIVNLVSSCSWKKIIDEQNFSGTLFRFPLRSEASEISDNLYNSSKVTQLFNSFIADAEISLLFLRNISSISLKHVDTNGAVNVRMKVSLASPESPLSQECFRRELVEGKTSFKTVSCFSSSGTETKTEWLVTTCRLTEGNVPEIDTLAEKLSFLPQVDVAFQCDEVRTCDSGRLSCFLPLPNNETNNTGLPVHINACFGLTDNRRYIKWQEEDQKNDESAMWNELLKKEVLPHVYLKMIRDAVQLSTKSLLPASTVYSLWPDLSKTQHNERWHEVALDVIKRLFQSKGIFSLAENGKNWVAASEAVFPSNSTDTDVMSAVSRLLIKEGENLVTVPEHVLKAIRTVFPEPEALEWVTPCYVRNVLHKTEIGNVCKDDKLSLLEYILSDGKYEELHGLQLLPLSDGSFRSFTNKEEDTVLIDNEEFSRVLLPFCKERFLHSDVNGNTIPHLRQIALRNADLYKIIHLDAKNIAEFVKKHLPRDWIQTQGHVKWNPSKDGHPPKTWLKEFWKFLNTHWEELKDFNGMPLIPLEPLKKTGSSTLLARLEKNSTLIFQKSRESSLPDQVQKVVKMVGGTVVKKDECLKHHDIESYVLTTSPRNVLQVLLNSDRDKVMRGIASASLHEKEEFKMYISSLDSVSDAENRLLSALPLFRLMSGKFVAAESKQAVILKSNPAIPADLPVPETIVQCANEADRRLLILLKVDLLDAAQLAIHLVDCIESNVFIKEDEQKIMTWILNHGNVLLPQSEELLRKSKNLTFIQTELGERKKPSSVFDPTSKMFQNLFDDNFFPPPVYRTQVILQSLKQLGLRTNEDEISSSNVLYVASQIQKLHVHSRNKAFKKAEALVRVLNRTDLLSKCSVEEREQLCQMQWVPCENSSSVNKKIQKKGLYRPAEIRASKFSAIVGHVMPLNSELSDDVCQKLNLFKPPPAEKVLENLCVLQSMVPGNPDSDYEFKNKLHSTYKFMQENIEYFREEMNKKCITWLWCQNEFVSPWDVVLYYPHELDLSLSHIKKVPEEFVEYGDMLKEFGVKETLSDEEIEDIFHDIKQSIDDREPPYGDPSELKVSIAILDWMRKNEKPLKNSTPVPVRVQNGRFTLQPLRNTVFCDISDEGLDDLRHDQEEFHVIHEEVLAVTAKWLKTPLLSTRILKPQFIKAEEVCPGIEQCGQTEPITQRIKNILKEYDEESDIFKELIQNAEDAGASTCKFLLDFRTHPGDGLIDDGMALCSGPCLWTFNNELFSEEDWKNIVRVGAASKENKIEKIGNFGLGFNAVYHLTDIPSILSGKSLLILDPNVTHLEKHIQSKANPGIKLDLFQERLFRRFPGQFRSYEGIFDCDLTKSSQNYYNGTLIKLPFRTPEEACKSEISCKVYDKERINALQEHFIDEFESPLLFLTNINSVSFQSISEGASMPPLPNQTQTVLKISRKIVCSIDISNADHLQDIRECLENLDKNCHKVIDCFEAHIAEIVNKHLERTNTQSWFLYSSPGTKDSLRMFQREQQGSKFSLPIGGVAVPLQQEAQNVWSPDESCRVGQAYCFLPLPIETGLPVHINGSFAVSSNRKALWQSGTKGEWNKALLQDATASAYITTLLELKKMSQNGKLQNYDYFTFWPDAEKVSNAFQPLVAAFYSAITQNNMTDQSLELFSNGQTWCSIDKVRFLDPHIENNEAVGELAMKVFLNDADSSYCAVPLPSWVRKSFTDCGFGEMVKERTFNWVEFYQIVFKNVGNMDPVCRNALILNALDLNNPAIDKLLKSNPCIPTQKTDKLQFINKLVHPHGKVACLYEPQEGRFLHGTKNDYFTPKRIQRLSGLGMQCDALPLEEIVERAKTISRVWNEDKEKAQKCLQCLFDFMKECPLDVSSPHWETLKHIPFLPAVITNLGNKEVTRLKEPSEVYSQKHYHVVNMTEFSVDHSNLLIRSDHPVLRTLGVNRNPPVKTVLKQLKEAHDRSDALDKSVLLNVAKSCYEYLNKYLIDGGDPAAVTDHANSVPFIYIEGRFVNVRSVAKNGEFEEKPYLHILPAIFSKFENLWNCVGIKSQFSTEQFVAVLEEMSTSPGPLSETDLLTCLSILTKGLYEDRNRTFKDCLLPDEDGVLTRSSKLKFNDTPWMPVQAGVKLCHKLISRSVACYFGVKTTRHHTLQKHLIDTFSPFVQEFGQHEKLTSRIKNIIKAYPSKRDILKELIQNADDAEATEIHFIWDKREHKTEKIFGEKWQTLQGPALCVYNNKTFSDEDLIGIQQLGEGGKHGTLGRTGKYGLGFNSVYQLTDCPSILTGDKYLCISDPNLQYVEIGTKGSPGCMCVLDKNLKDSFIDVYHTFLPDKFVLQAGTMFRLPLRTEAMADKSEISKCVVTDHEMRKLKLALVEDPEGLVLFLKNITKIQFHVIDTNGKMTDDFLIEKVIQSNMEEREGFQNQTEPITQRIKNILKEYDEESDIFKELIQNAEDAGASTCKFLLDFRTHPGDGLIDDGMALCSGPCLWTFNNELFSEEDWKNIVRVGAASKENKIEKIGNFGLGFNAVYHLTDIPSILSGKSLLILDPNVTHLEKHIQSKANPGIKLDLSQERLFRRFPGQFRSYEGIFDCDLTKSSQNYYNGTLIKLPFRTPEEACKSEISCKVYDKERINALQEHFIDEFESPLLFLTNINSVSFQSISEGASMPPLPNQTQTVLKISRKIVCSIDISNADHLQDIRECLENLDKNCHKVIDCFEAHIAEIVNKHLERTNTQSWFLYSSPGTKDSLRMFQREQQGSKFSLPIGGVAVPLQQEAQNVWSPDESCRVGQAYCFLPLPIETGLPVHINGSFAVSSNRKALWQSGTKGEWNKALLQDATASAYITTLLELKKMSQNGKLQNYDYFTFWPDAEKVSNAFQPLVAAFYSAITQNNMTDQSLELFSNGQTWCSIDKVRFLDPHIENNEAVGELAMKVFLNDADSSYCAVPLPSWVRKSFTDCGFGEMVKERTFNWVEFYQIVFKNVGNMDPVCRNALILNALDLNNPAIDKLLKSNPCIPTQKTDKLQFINKLVHPHGKVACLYEPQEGRFLHGTKNDYFTPKRIQRLSGLGMQCDALPLEEIVERAKTISRVWNEDKEKAQKCLQCLFDFMKECPLDVSSPHWETLKHIPFLPAVITNLGNKEVTRLKEPSEVYSQKHYHVVNMTEFSVDHSNLLIRSDHPVLRTLGVNRNPPVKTVLKQLKEAHDRSDALDKSVVLNVAKSCYEYLNKYLIDGGDPAAVTDHANSVPFIYIEGRFVNVRSVAKNGEFEEKPYLHILPAIFSKFENLWNCVGIKSQFSTEQFVAVLEEMSTSPGPLSETDLLTCLSILTKGLYEDRNRTFKDCLLPDEDGVLTRSSKLKFNDTPWMPVQAGVKLCHKLISRSVACYFGVKTTRHHTLQKHLIDTFSPFVQEFGQHEKLTSRIKNIIKAYPSKRDILKELIQNADDAEATEIHFIWDKREHKTEKIFGEKWQTLQGPALCVYNNKTFSDEDLIGIQQLGEGGKHGTLGRTGKYGLGFNSVYQLTDCPSILTGDKYLCISDPNLQYVEIGTKGSPGCMCVLDKNLKDSFIDVYHTFLPDKFVLQAGTMFRLPLRTEAMADKSEISKCVVTDHEMRKLKLALVEDPEGLVLFLKNITKIQFHVIDTNGKMTDDFLIEKVIQSNMEEREGFQNQTEPITQRIKNILKEYDEESDIFKELIQNAEDAGASTCKFLLDFRTHPGDGLIDDGMALCSGPCLWTFNNELFSEEDWKNIVRVGAASKENKIEKIGNFGLGFNAVYHLTDIPSILSGKSLLILDPNVTHLEKHIQSKANPGIKLDLSQERLFRRFPGQFRSYEGIFDCDLTKSSQNYYNGTLIKLPFRTPEEACKSEISCKVYDKERINALQEHFIDEFESPLLFLTNINSVSFQSISEGASMPPLPNQTQTVLKISRKIVCSIDISNADHLQDIRECLENLDKNCHKVIDCFEAHIAEIVNKHLERTNTQSWFLYSSPGTKDSLRMFQREQQGSKFSLPIGGVAVPLQQEAQNVWSPDESCRVGQAYCFLPLPIETGLPVHINGSFAVSSNRKALWQSGTKGEWNKALLQDATASAYITTLLELKKMSQNGKLQNYDYFTFWPDAEKVSNAFQPLVAAFYSAITQNNMTDQSLELFSNGQTWCSIDKVRFLDPHIENNEAVGELAMKVFLNDADSSYCAVPLPSWVRKSFTDCGFGEMVKERTFNWVEFYQIVFKNVGNMDPVCRNALILNALDLNNPAIDKLLKSNPCIPTQKTDKLQFINKLVHPHGKVACLYEPQEGRFLHGTKNDYFTPKRIQRLSGLGMQCDALPLEEIVERAKTISRVWNEDKEKAQKCLQCLFDFMKECPLDVSSPHWETLKHIPFLPAVITNLGNKEVTRLKEPSEVYSQKHYHVVNMTEFSVDHSNLLIRSDHPVLRTLGVNRNPPVKTVLKQLKEAHDRSDALDKSVLLNVAKSCYEYLNKYLIDGGDPAAVTDHANSVPFIYIEGRFVNVRSVAKNGEFEEKPYLHILPAIFSKFENLWNCVGIKSQFSTEQFVAVLEEMSTSPGPLSETDLLTCLSILTKGLYEDRNRTFKDCLLPDEDGVLTRSSKLKFNDTPWMPVQAGVKLCHKLISRSVACYFGVKTTRHHTLQKHLIDTFSPFVQEFGQHEKLTSRIKNIIKAYPSKRDILKELIQNADDAEATEIHFIWDKREHKTEKIFGEKWQTLQGPALCVYNNKTFSDEDLIGIQQLGEGGKHGTLGRTGKYGLGFNSVYQLTDCPSILTGDKYLCISDPNLQYVEIGTKGSPGCMCVLDKNLKDSFIDVYHTFLPDKFVLQAGTMFRLPLRTEAMADKSEISKCVVTDHEMRKLKLALVEDPEGLVLFLKNITKIQFHVIDTNGKMTDDFLIEKVIQSNMEEREGFQNHVRNSLKSGQVVPCQTIYNVQISSQTKQSNWVIAESFGSDLYNKNNQDGHPDHKVPHVALAACTGANPADFKFIGRAFCTLPLPGQTGLPVHVNGNFQLDDSRRDLWKEDGDSLRTRWNQSLKLKALAPLYVDLLNYLCTMFKKDELNSLIRIKSQLEEYFSYFPFVSKDATHVWHDMINQVYRLIKKQNLPLIPTLRSVTKDHSYRSDPKYVVVWSTVSKPDPTDSPHFMTESHYHFLQVLEHIGMNLVPYSSKMETLQKSFKNEGVEVAEVSPSSVISYLKKKTLNDPSQTTENLPLPISQTLIKDKESCLKLLDFCLSGDKKKSPDLNGLPLLLTKDQVLRKFNSNSPKKNSKFEDFFWGHESEFADFSFHKEHTEILQEGKYIESITIPVAAKFLEPVLQQKLRPSSPKEWSRAEKETITWLRKLWEFFADQLDKNNCTTEEIKKHFDWPILPVICPNQKGVQFLLSVRKLHTVVPDQEKYVHPVFSVLFKLGFVTLDRTFFQGLSPPLLKYLEPALMDFRDTHSVLEQLYKVPNSWFKGLSTDDADKLQHYLQSGIRSSINTSAYQRMLKSLPLFETIFGERQQIDHGNVFVLKTEFQARFPGLYIFDEGKGIFLKNSLLNQSLAESLDILVLGDLEYCVKFILPTVKSLTENQLLDLVRILLALKHNGDYENYSGSITSKMSCVPFIRDIHGCPQTASYFFDETVNLYMVMLPVERFVPEAFWKKFQTSDGKNFPNKPNDRIKSFLKKLGLNHKVSEAEMIDFALQIESEARGNTDLEVLKDRSSTLLKTVLEKSTEENFIQRFASMKFIFPVQVEAKLCDYHPAFTQEREVVAIKGSLLEKDPSHQYLIWTAMPILYLGDCTAKHTHAMKSLGAFDKPPSEQVMQNLKNICQSLCKTKNVLGTRAAVFSSSYAYLQSVDFDASALAGLPLILTENDKTLVKAAQAVLSLSHSNEFKPYLYATQSKHAVYTEFFKKIGVKEKPTVTQLCTVLQEIYSECCDKNTLHPNQQTTVKRVVEQIFHLIKKNKACHFHKNTLYLPSTNWKLYESSTLYFNDTVFQPKRLEDPLRTKLKLLEKLNHCHLGHDPYEHQKLLQLLPQNICPKLLTQVISENLVGAHAEQCEYGRECEFSGWFEQHLSSHAFRHGLICLIREQSKGSISQTEATGMCENIFGKIQIICCSVLQTELWLHKEPLDGTKSERQVYVKKQQEASIFYLKHSDNMDFEVVNEVIMHLTKEINGLLNNRLNSFLLLILGHLLLCKNMENVERTLERNGILNSVSEEGGFVIRQSLGDPIPEEWVDSLDMNPFNSFEKGEYVCFQKDKLTSEYCFAIIVECLDELSGQNRQIPSRYRIQIGAEFIEVSSLDLYQFKREKSTPMTFSSCTAIDVMPSESTSSQRKFGSWTPYTRPKPQTPKDSPKPQTLHEVKREIDQGLKEIWKMSKEDRCKAIKRLYLRWHPDKNLDNSKLANEAFKYLQNRIKDLEGRKTGSTYSSGDNFQDFWSRWNEEASRHRRGRERFYQNNSRRHYNFWSYFRPRDTPRPDIPDRKEAKRWYRQAECDLSAAQSEPAASPEWSLFKVHQAVEKALIASEFRRKGRHPGNCSITGFAQQISHYSAHLNELPRAVVQLRTLGVDAKKTQYPTCHPAPCIPHDQFRNEVARAAVNIAARLLKNIEKYITE